MIEDQNCIRVIPPKSDGIDKIPFWNRKHRKRNLVERCINKLNQIRNIATCYHPHTSEFLTVAKIGAVRLWLRYYESAVWMFHGA